jgi:hypothetical protein
MGWHTGEGNVWLDERTGMARLEQHLTDGSWDRQEIVQLFDHLTASGWERPTLMFQAADVDTDGGLWFVAARKPTAEDRAAIAQGRADELARHKRELAWHQSQVAKLAAAREP